VVGGGGGWEVRVCGVRMGVLCMFVCVCVYVCVVYMCVRVCVCMCVLIGRYTYHLSEDVLAFI